MVVYGNTLQGPLLYDDVNAIVRNDWLRGDVAAILTNPSWWAEGHGRGWRPMTTLSFAANYAVHGLSPLGYHAVNVLLHAGVSVLLLNVFFMLGIAASVSFLAALLFAAHPVHTEAVASIVGRAELLAAAGFFLAWRCFLAADRRRAGNARRSSRLPPWLCDASGCAVLFLALLAKENAVALIPVLILADLLYPPARGAPPAADVGRFAGARRLPLARYAALAGVTIVFFACRAAVLGSATPAIDVLDNPLVALPLVPRTLTAIKVVALYAWRLVFPLALAADYSYDQITAVRSVTDPVFVSGLGVLAAVLAAAWWTRRRAPEIALGLGLMALAFAVVSNLLVLIGTIMAERLLYLPSAGFCLVLASAMTRAAAYVTGEERSRRAAAPSRRLLWIAASVVVVLYAARTWTRNEVWTDPLRFFTAMVADAPRSARSHRELAAVLAERGRFDDARQEFERSLAIKPHDAATLYNLGNALLQAGRVDDAIASYDAALAAKPDFASAMVNRANAESMRGDQQAALAWMRKAIDLTPPSGMPSLRMNIANTLFRAGAREEARAEYRAALALAPDAPEILVNYATFLYAGGEYDEAITMYARAAAQSPTPTALVGLAGSYRMKGMTEDARATQARAERLFPRDPSVRQMGELLRRDGAKGGPAA